MDTSTLTKRFSSTPSATFDLVQRYITIMRNVLNNFQTLSGAPDVLYVMMATMELESSFRILHNNPATPAHIPPSTINNKLFQFTYRGIGKTYWNDPVISIAKANQSLYNNVLEGLSAQALMGTMGMYQVKNTRISNMLMSQANYRSLAEQYGLLVNPGASPSSVFTNDDTGAQKSMLLGCMDMEWKYSIFLKNNSPQQAIRKAVGAYVGHENASDILGTTPSMRINDIFFGSNSRGRALQVSDIFNKDQIYTKPIRTAGGQTETKQDTIAGTNNIRPNSNGCNAA